MMKYFFGLSTFLMLFSGSVRAQTGEQIYELQRNPNMPDRGFHTPAKHTKQLKNANGTFIYQMDTFSIQNADFVDDFSSDLFKYYNAQVGDADVTDTTFHQLYLNGAPASEEAVFHSDTTFYYSTTITVNDTTTVITPLPSAAIEVLDICNWPVTGSIETAWPSYNIYDTSGVSTDTVFFEGTWKQDAATFHLVEADTSLWTDSYVYVNGTYPISPPSINVATFDGLDENGYPYDFSMANTYGEADLLTSVPIDLTYAPGDSIYLSFYYQPEGIGNDPQAKDSLVVEFLNGTTGEWDWAWSAEGSETFSFTRVFLAIDQADYLYRGFRFRFKNYATLSGNVDHWHIDYVELGRNRSVTDVINDVAYVYPINGLLDEYTQMPWKHFKANPTVHMTDSFQFYMRNLTTGTHTAPHFLRIDYQGAPTGASPYQSNTTTPIPGNTELFDYQWVHAQNNIVYDTAVNDTCATFEVALSYGPFGRSSNDVIRYDQVFWNQYAYDDGSAEAGYGLLGNASQFAMHYTSLVPDSITAVYMYFNPVLEDVSNETFNLKVWAADGPGGEPGTVITENQFTFSNPEYIGTNVFQRIELESPALVNGDFYVGILQQTDVRLNIGLDLNTDASSHLLFNVNGVWENTSISGALMVRPAFKTDKDYLLPVAEVDPLEHLQLVPNPSAGTLYLKGATAPVKIRVFDPEGRMVLAPEKWYEHSIRLSGLDNGLYLIQVAHPATGKTTTKKILLHR